MQFSSAFSVLWKLSSLPFSSQVQPLPNSVLLQNCVLAGELHCLHNLRIINSYSQGQKLEVDIYCNPISCVKVQVVLYTRCSPHNFRPEGLP